MKRMGMCLSLLLFGATYVHAQVTQKWVARYNGPANGSDVATGIALDPAGNVYVTGYSWGGDSGYDYATVAYNASGLQLWVARYNGPGNRDDWPTGIALDAAGNVYVTGYSLGSDTGYDYATVAYDTSGTQLWVARYNGPVNGGDVATGIALDAAGNVYVTGGSDGADTGRDYATVAYDASGMQLWVARYNGPANGRDVATGIALDAAGNVYVTGTSWGGYGTDFDYATVAYNASGTQLWLARYDGGGYDLATAIALDAAGNVYVTGWSDGGAATGEDYATVAYDASGMQLWVARYNGPGNGADHASAIALDAAGNVYVTGGSDGGAATGVNYATVAYNASGTQLWVARYNGPANRGGQASAIALDAAGNVYVTGYSWASATDVDYATVAYDASGMQLWVALYQGPGNGEDGASAIALDAAGNVYVTGSSDGGASTGVDYATLKYSQP